MSPFVEPPAAAHGTRGPNHPSAPAVDPSSRPTDHARSCAQVRAGEAAVPPPVLDPDAIARLRQDLTAAHYTVEGTDGVLGPLAVSALRRENPIPARRVLAGYTDPAGILMALFALGAQLPRPVVEATLPRLGVDGGVALGLLAVEEQSTSPDATGEVRALVDLSPYAATDDAGEIVWWIASDLSELATGQRLREDHVLGVGGASLTLARITPREHVATALDLGCGSGIQALHATRHADHVVATDLSERALAFTAFNAALNGVEIELRQGSLLEPVAGERFDLVVTNPPFVITPPPADGRRWTYRDGGRRGDLLLAALLEELPAHLAADGCAVMLANWEIGPGSEPGPDADPDWQSHPRAWLEAARSDGVDAWVVQREREDPAQYAETWARDGGVTARDEAWRTMQLAWLDDFASRGTVAIGFGYVMLHRPADAVPGSPTRPGVLELEEVTGTGSGSLGEHVGRTLQRMDTLARMDDAAVLASSPVRGQDVVERRHQTPGAWDPMLIELVQGAGFGRVVAADQVLAATVGAADGTLTLAQIIAAVCALTDQDPQQVTEDLLPTLRELVRAGMVDL
jgi:methylase of polypeptide subunit release factors